jgi:serine/threonine-protein kinase
MPPAQRYQPGEILPGTVYRVVRHLATGGMGSVYDVEDITVEKRYVLKTLHPQLVSREDLARRMRDEARSLAKLQHPNIVDVITAGVTTDGMPFYVMERLIGQNLRVVLEKKSVLEVTHACRIAIDVADALEHAHENNIVHRDVKPENIFLHRNANGTTTTKLLDFGIVRLLDRKASHTHGKFIGTLRYASPEQIMGKPIGPATDIYSLGCVLFEMLCGRGPFDDAGDQYAIGAAHASEPAPPLSRFVRATPAVEMLVASMLSKAPEHRPRDCFVVASELRRVLREEGGRPRSATEVAVLSAQVPPTRVEQAGSQTADAGPTVQGMSPPSGAASCAPSAPVMAPPTVREGAGGPVSPVAPTLAAAGMPEGAGGRVQVVAQGHASVPQASPAEIPAARVVDRNAPTRVSVPIGATQRLAQNDTQFEPGLANDDAVRAAFGEPAPLVVPALGGSHPSSDIVFSPMHPSAANGTGPLAGEARTRPPERIPYVLVAVTALAFCMIGGAMLIARPWRSSLAPAADPSAEPAASMPAPMAVAAPPDTPGPRASAATPPATDSARPPGEPAPAGASSAAAAASAAPPAAEGPATPAPTAKDVVAHPPASQAAAAPRPVVAHPARTGQARPAASGYSPAVKFE